MLKLELLLRRIRGFDAKRMMVYVRDVKKETKTPTPVIMADMLYCILRYNVGFYDYHIFGFAHIHGAKARSTFFTMQDNWRLTRMVNSPEDRPYFENKLLFCLKLQVVEVKAERHIHPVTLHIRMQTVYGYSSRGKLLCHCGTAGSSPYQA